MQTSADSNTQPATESESLTSQTPATRTVAYEFEEIEQTQEDSSEQEEIHNLVNDGLSFFSFDSDKSTEDAPDTDNDEFSDTLNTDFSSGSTEVQSQDVARQVAPEPSPQPYKPQREVDKRQVKMVALVCVLAVGFVYAMLRAFAPSMFEDPATTPTGDMDLTPLAMTQGTSPQSVWPKPQPYPQVLRDPMSVVMAKTTVENTTNSDLNLNMNIKGIVYSQDNPSVIIDEGIYFVGDVVNGVNIVSITQTEVVFEANGKQWTQSM